MFTKKLEDQFSADLLNTVRGVLDEAKKCPEDCECEKCEDKEEDDEDEMKQPFVSAAQRKAVWANRADDGAGHPDKKIKMKKKKFSSMLIARNMETLFVYLFHPIINCPIMMKTK